MVSRWAEANPQRVCASCLGEFANRRDAKFCSPSCRSLGQHVRRKFGLTIEEYVARVRAPGVVCAISQDRPGNRWLCLDHDHATGALRGTLCDPCNRGLGRAMDNPALLRTLAQYVQRPSVIPDSLPDTPKGLCRMCLGSCDKPGRRSRGYCSFECSQRAAGVRSYGLTPEQYRWVRELSDGGCTTCSRPLSDTADHHDDRPLIDHCHESTQVRGILCNNCNLAVDCFRADPLLFEVAARYLESYA